MQHFEFLIIQWNKNIDPYIIETNLYVFQTICNNLSDYTAYNLLIPEATKAYELQVCKK